MFFGVALAVVAFILIDSGWNQQSIGDTVRGTGTKSGGPTAGSSVGGGVAAGFSGGSVVAVAQQALASKGNYQYDEIRPYPSSLFGSSPIKIDCSSFFILCYKAAKRKDPSGLGYSGMGNTWSLRATGKTTTTPQPGDGVFYDSPSHVAVYIGNGQVISMGQPGDPIQLSATYRPVVEYRTYP